MEERYRALVEASGLSGANIGEMDVGFALGPRLNAAGRMGHARDAVELFTTAQGERASEIAKLLSAQNIKRRAVEKEIFEGACRMAVESGMNIFRAHDVTETLQTIRATEAILAQRKT